MMTPIHRRRFLQAGTLALSQLRASAQSYRPPAGTMPTRPLGSTGVRVSALALGCGTGAITDFPNDEMAAEFIGHCLNGGITYLDTAATYEHTNDPRSSERRLGKALAGRRSQVFLNTKTLQRNAGNAMRDIETSLRLLRTDRLDSIQIHWIQEGKDDLAAFGAPDGIYTLLRKLRDQKVIRFIGVTSHTWPEGLVRIAEMYQIDTVLMPLNAVKSRGDFEGIAMGRLAQKKVGVIGMKVLGGMAQSNRVAVNSLPGKLVGTETGKSAAPELIRYAMSLPVSTAEVGIGDYQQLREDLDSAYRFRPMGAGERAELRERLSGGHIHLAYDKPGYQRA